ncbi:YjeO family protein [Pectobacterium odoriferum]|uniref:YjeO family protein n=1 Tax=Pectobacterium odoriferum TaxID=78398 RepID=UPI00215624F4|nr:YjeO family protein [Pectobacterium odoriferum]
MISKKHIYNIYFYAYSVLCLFLIHAFSSVEYEWLFGDSSLKNFCENPRSYADSFSNFIIIPLSILFFWLNGHHQE